MELAAAVMILGTVGQTISSVQAARGQARAASAEASSIQEAAASEETQFRRRAAQLLAKGRAIGAASGVDISTGSPLLLELDNARQAELEALNIRRTGQVGAAGRLFEADLARRSIFGTVLGGAARTGSILSEWMFKSGGELPFETGSSIRRKSAYYDTLRLPKEDLRLPHRR